MYSPNKIHTSATIDRAYNYSNSVSGKVCFRFQIYIIVCCVMPMLFYILREINRSKFCHYKKNFMIFHIFVFSGYGHSTPKTVGGKLFCMTYALVGIPLCMIMFQNVGERLNTFVTYLLKQIKKCFRMKNTEVSQTDLIFITMNLSTVIITAGALMFSHFERWKYIDSLYYCFITLTTIGFGDFVALQKENMLQEKPHYFAFSVIFILFGLAVISAAMNLLVLRFLTLNAEDERRDELQAAAAAQNAVHLEGDVIIGNSTVVGNAQERPEFQEVVSVCSCSCYKWRSPRDKIYNATTVQSNHISTVVPNSSSAKEDTNSETDSFLVWQRSKRASL